MFVLCMFHNFSLNHSKNSKKKTNLYFYDKNNFYILKFQNSFIKLTSISMTKKHRDGLIFFAIIHISTHEPLIASLIINQCLQTYARHKSK